MESLEVMPAGRRDSRGRRTLEAEVRAGLLAQFESSALSQATFARQAGVTYSTFAGWVQQRRRNGVSATTIPSTHTLKSTTKSGSEARPVFRELILPAPSRPIPGGSSGLKVTCGDIEASCPDVATAAALIKALREAR